MNTTIESIPPQALLLIGPGCPHCVALLEVMTRFVKSGDIAQLTIVNVAASPDLAQKLAVRTVPWLRLGEFELDGARSEGEIAQWLQRLNSKEGKRYYFNDLLLSGKLEKVISLVQNKTDNLRILLSLAADTELSMKVQLGISAVFEELQGSDTLQELVTDLGALSESNNARVRADAAHFLALTQNNKSVPYLQRLSNDEDKDVKVIAEEALADIDKYQ